MQLFYRIAADIVLIFHFAYVACVVLGFLAIVLGLWLKRPWARNFWLRMTHLIMILIVVAETLLGVVCVLTTWENHLRVLAGQRTTEGDFIAEWLHGLLFLDLPDWIFPIMYLGFGLAVLLTFVLAPPRWPGRSRSQD
jgi:hypothetical protein